jgi:alpha-ketoglutarate-dependent 2,4-dichlorophenoxyacetate dioxygenase
MAITIRQLHPLFAAEMRGLDLRFDVPHDVVERVAAAMAEYAVVVLPDQHIDDAAQLAFSRKFGPLELPPHMGLRRTGPPRIDPALYDVSNVDARGELLPAEHLKHASNRANEEFHTDSSFNALPTKWSLLSARRVPATGGDTLFADTRAAYDALPEATRATIQGCFAEHYFWKTRSRTGFVVTEEMERAMPPVAQPLVRVVPESGRSALYIGAHATHLLGWPRQEGEALLAELNAFATEPRFVYRHRWSAGDLVIWDNRCTLHAATEYERQRDKRDMRRSTINEHGPEISSTDALGIPAPV